MVRPSPTVVNGGNRHHVPVRRRRQHCPRGPQGAGPAARTARGADSARTGRRARRPPRTAWGEGALTLEAATLGLPAVAGTGVAQGDPNAATAREPVAVLGATTAQLLGIDRIVPGMRIWVGGPLVLRDRHPDAGQLRTGDRRGGPDRLRGRRRSTWASTGTRRRYTPVPPDSQAVATPVDGLLATRPTRRTRTRSTCPSLWTR